MNTWEHELATNRWTSPMGDWQETTSLGRDAFDPEMAGTLTC